MGSTLERIGYKLSPKHLSYYSRCPRKFHWKYIRNVKTKWHFSESLAIGNATHNALAELFGDVRDGEPISSNEWYASRHLSAVRYPTEGAAELRAAHLPVVVRHMEVAVAQLPRPCDVLHIEKPFTCPVPSSVLPDGVKFWARADLVIRHQANGVLDHIDFKTGSTNEDTFQNVLTRMAVAHELGVRDSQLRTINLFTKVGQYREIPSGRDDLRLIWPSVRDIVSALATDTTWVPASDPSICRWCEFNRDCDAAVRDPSDYDA